VGGVDCEVHGTVIAFATAAVVAVVSTAVLGFFTSGDDSLIAAAAVASVVAAVPKLHRRHPGRPVIPAYVRQHQTPLWVLVPTDFCAFLTVSAHQETEVFRIAAVTTLPELQFTASGRVQAEAWVRCPLD